MNFWNLPCLLILLAVAPLVKTRSKPLDLLLTRSFMEQANTTIIRYILPNNVTGPLAVLVMNNQTEAVIMSQEFLDLARSQLSENVEEKLKIRLRQKLTETQKLEIALDELEDLLNEIEETRKGRKLENVERQGILQNQSSNSSENLFGRPNSGNVSLIETSGGILVPISNRSEENVIASIKSALQLLNQTVAIEVFQNRTAIGNGTDVANEAQRLNNPQIAQNVSLTSAETGNGRKLEGNGNGTDFNKLTAILQAIVELTENTEKSANARTENRTEIFDQSAENMNSNERSLFNLTKTPGERQEFKSRKESSENFTEPFQNSTEISRNNFTEISREIRNGTRRRESEFMKSMLEKLDHEEEIIDRLLTFLELGIFPNSSEELSTSEENKVRNSAGKFSEKSAEKMDGREILETETSEELPVLRNRTSHLQNGTGLSSDISLENFTREAGENLEQNEIIRQLNGTGSRESRKNGRLFSSERRILSQSGGRSGSENDTVIVVEKSEEIGILRRLNETSSDEKLEANRTAEVGKASVRNSSESEGEKSKFKKNRPRKLFKAKNGTSSFELVNSNENERRKEKPTNPKTRKPKIDQRRKPLNETSNQTLANETFSESSERSIRSSEEIFEIPASAEIETLEDGELMNLFKQVAKGMKTRNITMTTDDDLEFLEGLLQIERRLGGKSNKSTQTEVLNAVQNATLNDTSSAANSSENFAGEAKKSDQNGRIRFKTQNSTPGPEILRKNMTKLLQKFSELQALNESRQTFRQFMPIDKSDLKQLKSSLQVTLHQLIKMLLANERLGVKTFVNEEAAFAEEALSTLNAMIISAHNLSSLNEHIEDRFGTMPTLVQLMSGMDRRGMNDDPERIMRVVEILLASGNNPNLVAEVAERTLHSGVNFRRGIRRQQPNRPTELPPIRGPILSNGTVMIMHPNNPNTTTLPEQHYQNEFGMMPAPQYQTLRAHLRSQSVPRKHQGAYNSDFGHIYPPHPPKPPTPLTDSMGRQYYTVDRRIQHYHPRGW